MKKLISLFVALFLAACTVFGAAAASGTVNLNSAYIYYKARSGSSYNSFYLPAVGLHNYAYLQDIDIFEDVGFYFNIDTRLLPGYTYHFQYRLYLGDDSDDQNMRFLPPDSLYLFEENGTTAFVIYPTVRVTQSNSSTLVDTFFRLEPGSDRGNILSAGNFVKFGQVLSPPTGMQPFEYDGIYVSIHTFEGFYDFDGSELDAMLAGMSDIKRGIDSVGNKLDDIGNKLDNIQDDVKQGEIDAKEWERDQANQVANDSLDVVDDSLKDVVDLTGIDRVVNSFLTIMNYEGTQLDFNMPEVKIPAIGDYIPETVLINEQSIPFETWLENVYIVKLIDVLNVLSVIGFGIWVIKQIMYWVQFFSADGDVHKLVDEGYGGSADPYA